MWSKKTIALASVVLASAFSVNAPAESLTDPTPPGHLVYPYKDLPGVTAPRPAVDDNFKCYTTIGRLRGRHFTLYHNLPALVYVCEQNGVISSSPRPPNRPYWQYNDPTR